MALVPSTANTTVTDPTLELQIALRDFETALTLNQQDLYRANVAKPDPESVTLFVADLAARNQGPHGKFLWKRLCPFLEATRQFTGIVNQFVSSNPAIASLVWGGVRTTILAAENACSYFGEVADLLMEIGRWSPTLTEFGQLYTGHIGLQHALCKYYTIVIRVCTKIAKAVQRTVASHFVSTLFSPFQSEFKPMINDLVATKDAIRDQISLAAKQAAAESSKLLEYESKENDIHRRLAIKFRLDAGKEHELMQQWRDKQLQIRNRKVIDKIMKRLSEINNYKAWRLALQPTVLGTASWFQNDDAFRDWLARSKSTEIWCRGNMGAGKTVVTANVISHLLKHKEADHVVAFHFCRSDEEASLQARAIVGTLARQMLHDVIWNIEGDGLNSLYERSRSSVAKDITDLILENVKKHKSYYVVIDGLDECRSTDILEIRDAIAKLCESTDIVIKTFLSTRPDIDSNLFKQPPEYKLVLSPAQVQADLDLYVDDLLDKRLENGALKLVDPTLILRIVKTLKDGSNGMFLWVLFLVGELCSCLSDREIIQALDQTPQGLKRLLDTILARIKTQKSAVHILRMLEYCGVSKRPLRICELQEALSLSTGQQSLDRTKMPTDMNKLISESRGLLFIDEVDESTHYVHHSLKPYLFGQSDDLCSEFQTRRSDLQLGHMCLTYLNFNEFQRQVTRTARHPDIILPPSAFGLSPLALSNKTASWVARKLLARQTEMKNLSLHELGRKAKEVINDGEMQSQHEIQNSNFTFLKYASAHWISHSCALDKESNPEMWNLFHSIASNSSSLANKPWSTLNTERDDHDWQSEGLSGVDRPLAWAVVNQHLPLLYTQILPESPRNINDLMHILEWTMVRPSHWEVGSIVSRYLPYERLLDKLMACITSDDGWKAVEFLRNSGVMEAYRWHTERTFSETKVIPIWTPLRSLAQKRYFNRAYYLLESESRLFFTDIDKGSALIEAISHGPLRLVERLLPIVTDVNFTANGGQTALLCAVEKGRFEIVSILLQAGANVNQAALDGLTPILLAQSGINIRQGTYEEMVNLLLHAGANIHDVSYDGWTVLMCAVVGDSAKFLRYTIDSGVDVNAKTSDGRTALDMARTLLDLAMIESDMATIEVRSDMVEILKKAGAVNNDDSDEGFGLPTSSKRS